jgi:hypothetical protein
VAAVRRVPPKAMPALLLQQDWALGLIGLKFAHHMVAGIPDGRHGLLGRPLRDTFLQLVWPPLQATALLLAAPYLITRGVLPLTVLPATALHVRSCCSFHVSRTWGMLTNASLWCVSCVLPRVTVLRVPRFLKRPGECCSQ